MKLSEFDYDLPKKLIAQEPIKPRDHSRLLLLNRRGTTNSAHANEKKDGCKIEHRYFYNIINYLQAGDVLVLNNSKVFPARLIGRKPTGGKIEVFLLHRMKGKSWQCLIGGRGAKVGLEVEFKQGLRCKIIRNNNDSTWEVAFNQPYKDIMETVAKIGLTPLPPYIKRVKRKLADNKNYQTIYADDKKVGSAAAPTAGFHFTPALIKKLKKKGVQFEYVTLHVGLGTFAPVKTDNIKKHKMHSEWFAVDKKTIGHICLAKSEGRRIIAVGTTSVRVLETMAHEFLNFQIFKFSNKIRQSSIVNRHFSAWTGIFIYPGYKFKIVDALITNFHLPKSTLLMLVSAFATKKNIKKAYREAIKKKYRFFSYGDAMFIY